jgi:DNA-binding beta-propeller fold protein YncE
MRGWAAVLGACLFAAGAATAAQPPPREIAFVANAEDGTVSLVDIGSRKLVGLIDINPEHVQADHTGTANYAQDVEVSPDGRTLYVSRGYLSDVAAFDIATARLLWKRPLNTARADHMSVSRDGRTIFVAAITDNAVYRISTAGGEITGHFATGVWPHDTKFSKDGRRVYNTSTGEIPGLGIRNPPPPTEPPGEPHQITIADADTLQVLERIKLEAAIRPWVFTPDGSGMYAQLSNQRAVVAYDLGQRKVVRRLELPFPPGLAIADWVFEAPHHGLALTPDGRTLCLAGRESDYVALVRAPELSLITTVKVGKAPGWADIADGGRLCLTPNARSNDLSFVSIPAGAEVARIPVGKGPKHVRVVMIPASVLAAIQAKAKP